MDSTLPTGGLITGTTTPAGGGGPSPETGSSSAPPPADEPKKGVLGRAKDAVSGLLHPKEKDQEVETAETTQRIKITAKEEDLKLPRWGCTPDSSNPADKKIDIGGNISLAKAQEKPLTHGDRVDWNMELYSSISGPLLALKRQVQQGLVGSKLTPLQRVMLAKFDTYEQRFREIDRRRAITDKKERAKPGNLLDGSEKIFLSGEETMQAVAFVMETEILAGYASGYEITNGGTIGFNTVLNDKSLSMIEQAGVPGKMTQAAHEITEALKISDPDQRKHRLLAAFGSAANTVGAAGTGLIIGTLFGNPLLGATVGAGVGMAVSAGEIKIGSWVISFGKGSLQEGIDINLKFNPITGGAVDKLITDNPLAREYFFKKGGIAQDYINHAELTRHGIYSRLGLRVEDLGTIDWRHPDPKQIALIKSMGHDLRTITSAQKLEVQRIAMAGDLWMVDLLPENLSYPAGVMLGFDSRFRENIQMILARDHPDLPAAPISSSVSWRDLSGLPTEEIYRIKMEAISLAGIDECREGTDVVLAEIAGEKVRFKKGGLDEITATAQRLKNGELTLHSSEITERQMVDENNRLANAKDIVTVITDQNKAITDIDGQIIAQDVAVTTATDEWNAEKDKQGNPGGASGLISQYETAINTAITEAITKCQGIDMIVDVGITLPTENTKVAIDDFSRTIRAKIRGLEGKLRVLNPVEAKSLKGAQPRGYEVNPQELNERIEQGDLINTQITELRQVLELVTTCQTKITEQETKIDEAEGLVRQKEDAKNSAEQKLTGLHERRQKAIDEIWRWVDPKNEQTHLLYGQGLYNTLLAEANLNVVKIRRELDERGIPILGEAKPEGGEKGVKKEGVIVSKVDKERAEGMEATVAVANALNAKVQGIREMGRDDLRKEFADPATSQDNVIRYLFGDAALARDKKPFYLRLLSKAGLVEAYFEYAEMDDSRAINFFEGKPGLLNAYRQSRANRAQLEPLRKTLADTYQLHAQGAPGLEAQVKSLEEQMMGLQDQNARLLTSIYDQKIAPILGEHSINTSVYVSVVVNRLVENAERCDPFADAVQSAETILPHSGPEGVMSILGPDINPRDGSWNNRGGTNWLCPEEYQVGGQNVQLTVNTSITNAGELGANVEIRAQDLAGALAVLPDDRAQIVAGSSVEKELDDMGLLPHLYAAAGTKDSEDNILDSWIGVRLPTTRPNMTATAIPPTQKINEFLRTFGLDPRVVDNIYESATVGARLNTDGVRDIARGIINKQIQASVLRLQSPEMADTAALETWLTTGSNYSLGGAETGKMFHSLAKAITENPENVNRLLLGDRFERTKKISNFSIDDENGRLILYHYPVGQPVHAVSLQEALQIQRETDRVVKFPGLTDVTLNNLLLQTGRNSMEAIRRRTP